MGIWLLTEATSGNKRGHKDIRGGAINQEIPVTSGVIWMKGQPPLRRCTRKAPTVHFVSVPIAVQRTTYAPPPEQISHLRQVRTHEFKSSKTK